MINEGFSLCEIANSLRFTHSGREGSEQTQHGNAAQEHSQGIQLILISARRMCNMHERRHVDEIMRNSLPERAS